MSSILWYCSKVQSYQQWKDDTRNHLGVTTMLAAKKYHALHAVIKPGTDYSEEQQYYNESKMRPVRIFLR